MRRRLVEIQSPSGTTILLDYGTDGRLSRKIDESGRVSSFAYDARGCRTRRSSGPVDYTYLQDGDGGPAATLVGVRGTDFSRILTQLGLEKTPQAPQFVSEHERTVGAANAIASLT